MNAAQPAAAWRFPYEPSSESDLLAADGLERRVLDIKLRLDGKLKVEIVLAAGYALARLGEGDMREGPIVAALLKVITYSATSSDLRGALAQGLGAKAIDQGATRPQRSAIARGLFRLAALPQARDAFESLASGELSNLVFADKAVDLHAGDVVPDPAERSAFASLLLSFEDERADTLPAWLAKP